MLISNCFCCGCLLTQDDPEDLSFKKGDTMTVLRKDEDEWWFAQHEDGRKGSIPVPYVKVVSSALLFLLDNATILYTYLSSHSRI